MSENKKALRSPCFNVLEWSSTHANSARERAAAHKIQEHGIASQLEEQILADACKACGMREVCRYREECEIGEFEEATGKSAPEQGTSTPVNPDGNGSKLVNSGGYSYFSTEDGLPIPVSHWKRIRER